MSSSNVERIKERLDIVDVVGSYVKLDKAGRNYKAKSPFTNEKTPSFYVSPERQLYYCFSSGKGGDMFSFIQDIEGTDFRGSLKILAERAGITLENESREELSERDKLIKLVDTAKKFYVDTLSESSEAKKYVEKRGITDKAVTDWSLGYAPHDWRELRNYLKQKNISDDDMRKVGLIKEAGEGKEPYDTFRDRIMFPIFDTSGRCIAFSGRILHPNDKAPKYLNSPDTALFKKSQVLYGLHKAKTAIRRKDYSVLVEGQMDLVLSHQAGIDNTVASSGTAITEEHLKRLKQLSNRIIISFDSDEAGFKAANRTAQIALSMGMEVKVVLMPEGKDPADIISESVDTWKDILKRSKHIIDFYIERLLQRDIDRRNLAKEVAIHVLPYLAKLSSDIEKSHFVSRIAKETGFREEAIWEDLKKVERSGATAAIPGDKEEVIVVQAETPEDRVAAIYYWQKTAKDPLVEISDIEAKLKDLGGDELVAQVTQRDPGELNKILFEIEEKYGTKDVLVNELEKELYKRLEIHILIQKNNALEALRREGDEDAISQIFQNRKKIDEIQHSLT